MKTQYSSNANGRYGGRVTVTDKEYSTVNTSGILTHVIPLTTIIGAVAGIVWLFQNVL